MKIIWQDRSFRWTVILTFIYLSIGFLFLHLGLADYGWAVFVLLPFSLGVAIGSMPLKKWGIIALFFTIIIFLVLLYFGALEGMVCILMSLPIIIPLVFIGILMNRILVKQGVLKSSTNLKSSFLPLVVVLIFSTIENYFSSDEPVVITVKTERVYPYSPLLVYDAIKSVDTLIAEKPFLMKLDLPVPHKCVLEKEALGGLRTCYFDGGTITEKITEIEPGRILKMDVIDYQLTGRQWLGFKEAIYTFERVGPGSCKLTRITTYTSVLKPRFYWQPLEELGIQQEHEYVLDNLENDLKQ